MIHFFSNVSRPLARNSASAGPVQFAHIGERGNVSHDMGANIAGATSYENTFVHGVCPCGFENF
jgi:hypothetical protein